MNWATRLILSVLGSMKRVSSKESFTCTSEFSNHAMCLRFTQKNQKLMRVVYLFVLLAKSQSNVIWSLSVNVHHTPDSERRFLLVRKRGSVNRLLSTSFALLMDNKTAVPSI